MKNTICIFILGFLCLCNIEAQTNSSQRIINKEVAKTVSVSTSICPIDLVSSITKEDEIGKRNLSLANFKDDYPSPKKAIIFSATLPGLGQIYNKKYWKLPIVYAGIGSMVFLIIKNNKDHNTYETAWKIRNDDNPNTMDDFIDKETGEELLSNSSLRLRLEKATTNRELSYFGLALCYILTGVDAFVDAHLKGFDISDDLTLEWSPDYNILPGQKSAMSLNLYFQHKARKTIYYPVKF